ncbi:MAG: hypothetical protein GVY24_06475 [Planctomycetes bacterium]|jgi:hypothetical protein|nr:hypothetical protein [Planctomycetota bacterium]
MKQRGWSDTMIREALQTTPIAVPGKRGPALRYVHPQTGRSLVVDAGSGKIFHVGGDGFRYG